VGTEVHIYVETECTVLGKRGKLSKLPHAVCARVFRPIGLKAIPVHVLFISSCPLPAYAYAAHPVVGIASSFSAGYRCARDRSSS